MGASSEQPPLKKTLLVITITLTFAVIFFLYIQSTFHILRIKGDSMAPCLENGDILLAVSKKNIQRFDLIVFKDPFSPNNNVIKRLVAFAGETVTFKNEQLFINSQATSWPDSTDGKQALQQDLTIYTPQDSCTVLGDNPFCSKDSRHFGPIPLKLVWAQVLFRLWPPKFLHASK